MRLFFLILLINIIIFPTYAIETIGKISESSGKIQIKTIKAKRIKGGEGTQINAGDLLKVKKKSMAMLIMKDKSKFQISEKTTLIFDEFLYDAKNQKMRARIINGALAYDGKKIVPNSDRKFNAKGFTLTVRGTKFAGKFSSKSQVVLLKGAIEVSGKNKKQLIKYPMQSLKFDASGIGKPFKMTIKEIQSFFKKNGLNFNRLVGPNYKENLKKKVKTCFGSNCGN